MGQLHGTGQLGARLVRPRVHAIGRERLLRALAGIWDVRLGLVVGPAGWGKTTLLSQFAAKAGVPYVWYRAEGQDGSAAGFMGSVGQAAAASFSGIEPGWATTDDAITAFESWTGGPGLLVVDDLHYLEGTPAEACLGRLVQDAPGWLAILVASRRPPTFNLSRLRVSGELLELGPDDLRFRSWEVEDLFREVYREPLSPDALAALARRTEGWPAGLQLFHLATRGKPAGERQEVIRSLGSGSRLVREYLARNVIDELPDDLTDFLLGTCVLGRLTGPLCDQLLERAGSDAVLAELERRHVFCSAVDDLGTYRYHEVFRSHLEFLLVERHGDAFVRSSYRRAAPLLVAAGMLPEALRAYARAEDWDAANALLRNRGEQVINGSGGWIDALPDRLVDHDPWLLLAAARRSIAAGRWSNALAQYRQAEGSFESSAGADVCRRERQALAAWTDPHASPAPDWTGLVRQASQRQPLAARERAAVLPDLGGRFAEGIAALLAGHVRDACRTLAEVAAAVEARPLLALGAQLAGCVAGTLTGDEDGAVIERLARMAEQLGAPWLAHLARAVLALTDHPGGQEGLSRFAAFSRANGDPWGSALATYITARAALRRGEPAAEPFTIAAAEFHALGAGVPAAWATAGAAMARAKAGEADAGRAAQLAESSARASGVPGAEAVALMALSLAGGARDRDHRALGEATAAECGLSLVSFTGPVTADPALAASHDGAPDVVPDVAPHVDAPPPSVAICCFGEFRISVHGTPVDCTTVRVRARAALHLLAVHAPRAVHRETLIAALWPDADTKAGTRNLHVVVSSLRQLLEPGVPRGASALLVREGEAYRLELPTDAESDVIAFEAANAAGRQALVDGERGAAMAYFATALDLYRADLLVDDGAAEWVLPLREGHQSDAIAAAIVVAELALEAGRPEAAAAACDRGLRLDRYRDALWRLRIRASEANGDLAESARLRQAYRQVLVDLGIGATA